MTPRDWFGVLVRGGGLYMFVVAIGQAIAAITQYDTSWERDRSHPEPRTVSVYFGSPSQRYSSPWATAWAVSFPRVFATRWIAPSIPAERPAVVMNLPLST
jgi:hypothetical protein